MVIITYNLLSSGHTCEGEGGGKEKTTNGTIIIKSRSTLNTPESDVHAQTIKHNLADSQNPDTISGGD